MNDVDLRGAILLELERIQNANGTAIEVAALARRLGAPAVRVATITASLVHHGQVIGDGNMMGFVVLSQGGRAYLESVRDLTQQ